MLRLSFVRTDFFLPFMLFWVASDVLRKWFSLNVPIYLIQLLTPAILIFCLLRLGLTQVPRRQYYALVFLVLSSSLALIYSAFFEYGPYLLLPGCIFLCVLLSPIFLLYTRQIDVTSREHDQRFKYIHIFIAVLLVNTLLTLYQSYLPASHILSVGVGGAVDGAHHVTGSSIAYRAPGLFSFVTANGFYGALSIVYIIANYSVIQPFLFRQIAFLYLLILPYSTIRTVSRTSILLMIIAWIPILRSKPLSKSPIVKITHIASLMLVAVLIFFLSLYINFSDVVSTLSIISERFSQAEGLIDGIIKRFAFQFIYDYHNSGNSVLFEISSWLHERPHSFFFGEGIGLGTTLINKLRFSGPTSYAYFDLGFSRLILGEHNLPTLLVEIGLINISLYIYLLVSAIIQAIRIFSFVHPASRHKSFAIPVILILLIALSTSYYRPSTFMAVLASILLFRSLSSPSSINNRISIRANSSGAHSDRS